MASLFSETGSTYTSGADGMYYSNLELIPKYGKYCRIRYAFLRHHKKACFTALLFGGKLASHQNESEDSANSQRYLLTRQASKYQGINEVLKVLELRAKS